MSCYYLAVIYVNLTGKSHPRWVCEINCYYYYYTMDLWQTSSDMFTLFSFCRLRLHWQQFGDPVPQCNWDRTGRWVCLDSVHRAISSLIVAIMKVACDSEVIVLSYISLTVKADLWGGHHQVSTVLPLPPIILNQSSIAAVMPHCFDLT